MGLELFFSWQALAIGAITSLSMSGLKRALDIWWPERKDHRWFTRIAMPVINGGLGFAAGQLPVRPDAVVEYVEAHSAGHDWVTYGVWGVLVGSIIGHYLYRHLKSFVQHTRVTK